MLGFVAQLMESRVKTLPPAEWDHTAAWAGQYFTLQNGSWWENVTQFE